MPSLPFQPGNGNLNRRGPIQDMEILPFPGRRNELPFRPLRLRPRRQVVPPGHEFDGAIISDGEDEEEVEEHEYLPTKTKIGSGSGNHFNNVSVHLVSADHDNEA